MSAALKLGGCPKKQSEPYLFFILDSKNLIMKRLIYLLVACVLLSTIGLKAQEKITAAKAEKIKIVKVEKGYTIVEKGSLLTRAVFRQDKKAAGNIIEIEALNVSGGSVSLGNYTSGGGAVMPPANITNIISVRGNYLSTRDISKSGRGVVMQLVDVNYPYRGRISVSEQILEFEITEPGFWKISIAVSE